MVIILSASAVIMLVVVMPLIDFMTAEDTTQKHMSEEEQRKILDKYGYF